jgi:ankyrin repeat protein
MQVLMDNGASPSVEDFEGNTALHVKCYGEAGKESEVECVEMLLDFGAKITLRNNRVSVCLSTMDWMLSYAV